MNDVTEILQRIENGDDAAADTLIPLVYGQLRQLAQSKLRNERADHTLQATALVHEAYLRLVGESHKSSVSWDHRGHFFAAAAEAMRRILVESVRRKRSLKRGGDWRRVPLAGIQLPHQIRGEKLLDLDDALDRLEKIDPIKASLIKLRVFSGFSNAEAAKALGISSRTADRYWSFARAWLINSIARASGH